MPAIRGNGLEHLNNGLQDILTKYTSSVKDGGTLKTTPNSAFLIWRRQDQLLLN